LVGEFLFLDELLLSLDIFFRIICWLIKAIYDILHVVGEAVSEIVGP